MKKVSLALTLAAALAAPLAASAQTLPDGAPRNVLLVVDARSGRMVGELVPVDGQSHALLMIGNVSTRPAAVAKPVPPAAPAAPAVLTVGQEDAVYDAFFREQFHIPSGF